MPAVALRSPRSDNRVSILLDAAARLFADKGYVATSMRDIAQDCGMLPGSLYYHFAAKEDLLVAVYERGVAELLDQCPHGDRKGIGPLVTAAGRVYRAS